MENIPQIIEIALLLLIAFLIGCIIGWLFKSSIFRAGKDLPPPADIVTQKPSLSLVADQAQPLSRPKTLPAPRDTGKDDLKQIKGVGPKLESALNKLGIYHFDQIAVWDSQAIDWVDDYLSAKGRIARDHWIDQARELAKNT